LENLGVDRGLKAHLAQAERLAASASATPTAQQPKFENRNRVFEER
jgi:hypothetical protein